MRSLNLSQSHWFSLKICFRRYRIQSVPKNLTQSGKRNLQAIRRISTEFQDWKKGNNHQRIRQEPSKPERVLHRSRTSSKESWTVLLLLLFIYLFLCLFFFSNIGDILKNFINEIEGKEWLESQKSQKFKKTAKKNLGPYQRYFTALPTIPWKILEQFNLETNP